MNITYKFYSIEKKIREKNMMIIYDRILHHGIFRTLTKLATVANSKSNSVTELDHFLFLSDWIVMDRRMISHLIIEALCIFPVPDIISIISIFHELFQSFFTIAQNNFESRTTIECKLLEERIIYNIWKEHFPRIRHNESGKIWMYIRVRILERDNFDINAIIERN